MGVRRRYVLIAGLSILLLLAVALPNQTAQNQAPEITEIELSAVIPPDGSSEQGTVSFQSSADLQALRFTVREALDSVLFGPDQAPVEPGEMYEQAIERSGLRSGEIPFEIASHIPQPMTLEVAAVDRQDRESPQEEVFVVAGITQPEPDVFLLRLWGRQGSGNGEFKSAGHLAFGPEGNIFLADIENHRIQKFSPGGEHLVSWGSFGQGEGQFNKPTGLSVDNQGNVYVADRLNHRIQKFTTEGAFQRSWGDFGLGSGEFQSPLDVATDSNGNIYVADGSNHRIQKFDPNTNFLRTWGEQGSIEGKFQHPCGIATDTQDNVYVSDCGNDRVQKFDSGGNFSAQWGSTGVTAGQFQSPWGIATGPEGRVYVADRQNHRVQAFTEFGEFVAQWGPQSSNAPGKFNNPIGVGEKRLAI